jgi:hypothetical protein
MKRKNKNLPDLIYQFRSNDTSTLSNLINGQIYFNNTSNFNDPFEFTGYYKTPSNEENGIKKWVEINYKNRLNEKDFLKKIDFYKQNPQEIDKVLNEQVDKLLNKGNAVSCFTIPKNIKNTLMWTHYANSHKGICIGFSSEMELIHVTEGNNKTHIFSPTFNFVFYSDQKLHNRFCDKAPKPLDLMYQKATCWKDEDEIRGLSPKKGLHFLNDRSDLKEIYLGIKIPKYFENEIIECLNSFDDYENVKLRKMYMKRDSFKLYSREIKWNKKK